ncbi:tetratricopeptide repeat protein [Sphingomonas mesophila]|uniref:tetratricopeptide repeat protein n=1 Tax=Sphingomonas mesophila TaxID=2303576 RepID=UPI0013C30ACC|nr:tetratricopeptide repeat protein [Sphingomonas mesophila]
MHACDALSMVLAATGDRECAAYYGSLALRLKDEATAAQRGTIPLNRPTAERARKVISFTLFGSQPRYLRGALLNLLSARRQLPDWTCRFYVDPSVDQNFLTVVEIEGAELVHCNEAGADRRMFLARRFLVNDDPSVDRFLVRDCDSVIGEREVAAVAEWLASGAPFHAIRDWHTHTDLMLAGLWGGIAGVFPNMQAHITRFAQNNAASSNWDQLFLREMIWPNIRDSIVVHDRLHEGHAVRPIPGTAPTGDDHIGQNEFVGGLTRQAHLFAPFARRIPALGFRVQTD